MADKFLNYTALTEFLTKVKSWSNDRFATKAVASSDSNGLMSSSDKDKLDGIAPGATANVGTITGISMNGTVKGTSGTVDLGTVITAHQDISGKANKSDIPTKVSQLTNDSGYTTNTGTITGIKMNGASKGTSGVVDLGTVLTAHQDISGKADKSDIPTKVSQLTNDSGYTTNTGTITGIKMNGASKGTSGVVDLGTVLTAHQDISGKVDKINITAQGTQAVYPIKINAQGQITAYGSAVSIPAAVAVKGDAESSYRTGNVNLTKANIGLGNVGNFKAVSTAASQGLTDTEKSNARTNIGAGTSSFSGSYTDLSNKPGNASTSSAGFMSSDDKTKLNGIATGAEVNQNAFSNVVVGSTTISADGKTDSLTLVAGSNVTLTGDATNDKVTIAATNTWRGIQNNLTSDSTSDSLAAAQGKALKALVDGKANASHTHSADNILGGYLNIHPENSPTLIPFMNNDIAYLLKRGGSAIVKYDGTTQQSIDISNCFDASPSYWTMNPTGITTIVIELTLHKTFTWTNTVYVDFGSGSWRPTTVKIEAMNINYSGDTWAQKYNNTNNSSGHCYVLISHTPVGASSAGGGFNKLRFTFSGWVTPTNFRIAQLGVYTYGSAGLRETFLPRDGGHVFGPIYPASNNSANLGSTSNYWGNAYITNINGVAVGSSPKFTDTTYDSKTAASGGTDVSLVTTGEKYTWNNKQNALVSGTNIKSVNGNSLLGSGNITISSGVSITDIYPVGSIYMSVNNTDPGTLFAGTTWERIQDSFLLSAGSTYTAGDTGGSATHSHTFTGSAVTSGGSSAANTGGTTLTTNQIPSHNHSISNFGQDNRGANGWLATYFNGSTTTGNTGGGQSHSHSMAHTHSVTASGSVGDGNNMPPYLVVYMWKRTA